MSDVGRIIVPAYLFHQGYDALAKYIEERKADMVATVTEETVRAARVLVGPMDVHGVHHSELIPEIRFKEPERFVLRNTKPNRASRRAHAAKSRHR